MYRLLLPVSIAAGSQARGMLSPYISRACHDQVSTKPFRPSQAQSFLTYTPQPPPPTKIPAPMDFFSFLDFTSYSPAATTRDDVGTPVDFDSSTGSSGECVVA